ncbi:MAG: hypothetical protein ABIY50_12915 [Ignavibacteria bacterium]
MTLKMNLFNGRQNPIGLSDDSESLSILNRIKYGPRSRFDRAVAQYSNCGYKLII